MNLSLTEKNAYATKAVMGLAVVCLSAMLLRRCLIGDNKPTHSPAMVYLSSSIIDTVDKGTDAAAANPINISMAPVPEPTILNTAIKENPPQWYTVRMRVTAYCACSVCCGRFADGRTANGHIIRSGDRFAAAPPEYPFGTEIIVPQYNDNKPVKVIDRGGSIKGNRLDVFFPSHKQATKWGVKYLGIKVRNARIINQK